MFTGAGAVLKRTRRLACWRNFGDMVLEENEAKERKVHGAPYLPRWELPLLTHHRDDFEGTRPGAPHAFERWYRHQLDRRLAKYV